ncbi:cytochrome-c peroxidase [Novosphingobium rosa]|uniref:cytochrome-c peroxidase n=1 Tax=Novosphingobium rosa TaxID=76978 RepID=UPI000AECC91B|nr:cytochrome c peroxidase [Novosphingobium rosa]
MKGVRLLALALLTLGTTALAGQLHQSENTARVELGHRLFYDADLSRDGTMACATCHEQFHAFADGNRTHPGVTDEPGRRNVPGLGNVGLFSPLTWADPRQTTLAGQVSVPVLGTHPVEMGMKGQEGEIIKRLSANPCYRMLFAQAFPATDGALTYDRMAEALGSFEAMLISRGSPYDQGVLSAQARAGQKIIRRDCAACHAGPDFTDLRFHALEAPQPRDLGVFEITGKVEDKGAFRTPSLRNVMVTAPYFHDGASPTLAAAIARHGLHYAAPDQAAIEAFLAALTDQGFLTNPALSLPKPGCPKAL